MEETQRIQFLSTKLLEWLDVSLQQYQKTIQDGVRGDFHQEVKPFADKVKEAVVQWEEASLDWIKTNRPKNLHTHQIETAANYLEVIAVQAFFPETSKKRFLDQTQSVEFILNSLVKAIEENRNEK